MTNSASVSKDGRDNRARGHPSRCAHRTAQVRCREGALLRKDEAGDVFTNASEGQQVAHRELLRLPRKRNLATRPATNQPAGQITQSLSSPSRKNIPLNLSGKSALGVRPSHPMRGADRGSSRTRGGMRWMRKLRLTIVARADGEVVRSWRPTLAPSLAETICEATVAIELVSPGRSRSKP
jgi:hypothetical protein